MEKELFKARDYLRIPPDADARLRLIREIEATPERLMKEFLMVAIEPSEDYDCRTRALIVLSSHANELGASSSTEVIEKLKSTFERDFPTAKLRSISDAMQGKECSADGYLAYLFCIAFAAFAPESAQQLIGTIRDALENKSLDATLTKHLETIRQKRILNQ